jgi:hypothetical protein
MGDLAGQVIGVRRAVGPGHSQQDQQPISDPTDGFVLNPDRRLTDPLNHGAHASSGYRSDFSSGFLMAAAPRGGLESPELDRRPQTRGFFKSCSNGL